VTGHRDWHDDLLQEAHIHLWVRESERPGQTLSWYLHGCRCHLCNWLRRGHSIDSPKHFSGGVELNEEAYDSDTVPDCLICDEESVSATCAHDDLEQLASRLDSTNRAILLLLAEGF